MKRIYVAGAYSANNVITVLENIREGMRMSTEVFLAGFAPFCPWLDFHYTLMLRPGEELTIKDYYAYSIAWMVVSDAVLLVPGWENSKGTLAEIAKAEEIGLPVFESLDDLKDKFPVKITPPIGDMKCINKKCESEHVELRRVMDMNFYVCLKCGHQWKAN